MIVYIGENANVLIYLIGRHEIIDITKIGKMSIICCFKPKLISFPEYNAVIIHDEREDSKKPIHIAFMLIFDVIINIIKYNNFLRKSNLRCIFTAPFTNKRLILKAHMGYHNNEYEINSKYSADGNHFSVSKIDISGFEMLASPIINGKTIYAEIVISFL